MNFLLFYLFVFITGVTAFITLLNVTISLKARLKWVTLFCAPLILYIWDYPLLKYQLEQDCIKEGGLKIFIPPDKAEKLKLAELSYIGGGERESKGLLKNHFPELQEVIYRDEHGKDKGKYFSIKVNRTGDSARENEWIFSKTEIQPPEDDIYTLKRERFFDQELHYTKQFWSLQKADQTFAKITNFSQSWSRIRYPSNDMHGWSCYNFDKKFKFTYPEYELTKLLTKKAKGSKGSGSVETYNFSRAK